MQQPLPQATPTQPMPPVAQPNQVIDTSVPDAGVGKRGWFPRWWLLSALFCSVVVGIVAAMLPLLCSVRPLLVCQATTWTDWRQGIIVGGIWLLFLFGWLIAYMLGVAYVEVDQLARGPIASFMRTISEFETTYYLLYIYALIAFWLIVIMWYFNRFQAVAFDVCTFVVFVGSSCFLYRRQPRDRRTYLLIAAILAVFCAGIMFLIRLLQPAILAAEILVVVIWIMNLFHRIPNPPGQNPVQVLAAARANAITPGQVFLSLLRSPFRNRRAQNQNNPNNPPPQVQGPLPWP